MITVYFNIINNKIIPIITLKCIVRFIPLWILKININRDKIIPYITLKRIVRFIPLWIYLKMKCKLFIKCIRNTGYE